MENGEISKSLFSFLTRFSCGGYCEGRDSLQAFAPSMSCSVMLMRSLLVLVLCSSFSCAAVDESLSFGPIYEEYDEDSGERLASSNFNLYGSARAHSSFLRLTTDRQSKHGGVWSKGPIESTSMSAVMEFRISGQGKSLFGDGIALWLADQAYFSTGTYHGFNEYFKGVGIVIDTYKNRGDKSHKDVSLVVNDGQSDYSEKAEELKGVKDSVTGCMSNVRYHAKAHDFNAPFNTSRVMVNVVGRSINVKVDPRATGDWEECFEVRVEYEGLGSDWLARSHVGITASTGDLADNHDIIAFSVYDNQDAAYASLSAVRGAAPGWVDTSSLEGKTKAEKPSSASSKPLR